MNLLTLENVMKQEDNRTVLKNINLIIREKTQIGIKMSSEESLLLFALIYGHVTPSSGVVNKKTNSIFLELKDDGLYERLTVQNYLKIFKTIADFEQPLEKFIAAFSLSDVWQMKIKHLTVDQRKRISLFRIFLFSPSVVLIESPLTNLTDEGIELYLKALEQLRLLNVAILFSSNYIEELLLLSHEVYRYTSQTGLEKTDLIVESEEVKQETEEVKPKNIFKISCKLEDKTIFFSPEEIDFIESINSVSNIRIGDEYFPTDLTMTELEEKLTKFGFFRCHRSYLVNLQRVSELVSYSKNSYTLILKENSHAKLPLSRARLEEMQELIGI